MPHIYDSSRHVLESFSRLKALDIELELKWLSTILDQEARYRVWAGSIGAYHHAKDTRSADVKLENARQVHTRILQALDELLEINSDLYDILSGTREGFTNDNDDGIDSLDEPRSEIEELLLCIDDVILTLFKVSVLIRSSGSRNRAAYAKSATRSLPTTFDIDHVSHKFPKLRTQHDILHRLGTAITRRREFLMYAQDHHNRIARNSQPTSVLDVDVQNQLHLKSSAQKDMSEAKTEHTRPTLAQTTQTGINSADIGKRKLDRLEKYQGEDDALSDAATFISSATNRDERTGLHVARMSDLGAFGQPFQCPYCCGMVIFKRESAWRQHVFADLKAYVCTSPSCSVEMFESRSAWEDHERSAHRRAWKCPGCPDANSTCRNEIETHLQTAHAGNQPALAGVAIDVASPFLQLISPTECCFCNDWDMQLREERRIRDGEVCSASLLVPIKQFFRHVGDHLEQLALFAIGPDIWQNSDELVSNPDRISQESDGDDTRSQIESHVGKGHSMEKFLACDERSLDEQEWSPLEEHIPTDFDVSSLGGDLVGDRAEHHYTRTRPRRLFSSLKNTVGMLVMLFVWQRDVNLKRERMAKLTEPTLHSEDVWPGWEEFPDPDAAMRELFGDDISQVSTTAQAGGRENPELKTDLLPSNPWAHDLMSFVDGHKTKDSTLASDTESCTPSPEPDPDRLLKDLCTPSPEPDPDLLVKNLSPDDGSQLATKAQAEGRVDSLSSKSSNSTVSKHDLKSQSTGLSGIMEGNKRSKKIKNGYPCPWPGCYKRFDRDCDQRKHHRNVHSYKDYKCTICDKGLTYPKDVRRHMSQVHGIQEGPEYDRSMEGRPRRRFPSLKSVVRLLIMLSRWSAQAHKCKICGESIYPPDSVRRHERLHNIDPQSYDNIVITEPQSGGQGFFSSLK